MNRTTSPTAFANLPRADSPMKTISPDLPGADLVASGIEALKRGDVTIEALLVCVGATRMRLAGLRVPAAPQLAQPPEIELYLAIGAEHPGDTHSRYNALIRRLVSFERALERLGRDRAAP